MLRFTVIGHSCLYVETDGGSILVDPWLFGSAGWRSWWHYPPTPELRPEWLEPDHLYLTHHHPDHFHYPSMRRISRDARVLIPRFGVDVMKGELASLGFEDVRELDHARVLELGEDLRVASYQYGFDDTAFVIDAGGTVLVNLNDCKIRGRALTRLKHDFGDVAFAFKGHSFAQGYPACYEADDPADLELVDRRTYVRDFLDAMRVLQPRFAIPFGSMVGFLHPESFHVNEHLITPGEVAEAAASADGLGGTTVFPLAPGDGWDESSGFRRSAIDWYDDRDRHLRELAESVRPKVDAELRDEAGRRVSWEAFSTYFGRFLRELPPVVPGLLVREPIVFEVPSAAPDASFVLDFRRRAVRRETRPPPGHACVIHVPEGVLADAMDKGITHFIHGSMRFRTDLRPGGVRSDLAFWGLLMIWEIGYLPWTRLLRRRFVEVAWRRRREMVDLAGAVLAPGALVDGLFSRLAPRPGARGD